ncbi:antifreeze protein [Gymnodinialimonas sp. 2305UL16-5]|uniref:antifreeze protein n=1 Tax=Gymnodinialimonas mytili TaxID=3126503 RepID=UPI0030A4A7FC
MRQVNPFDYWRLSADIMRLGVEANAVIWMRVMGLWGAWNVTEAEATRMVTEKPQAFFQATEQVQKAIWRGASPEKVAAAALKPLARKTGSNRRRLAKRGRTR